MLNKELIIKHLIDDGDLRDGEDLEENEIKEDDDLGFYQFGCQYLVSQIEKIEGVLRAKYGLAQTIRKIEEILE